MNRCTGFTLTILLITMLVVSGCYLQFPGSTDPLIKIGLVAPFEGQFRSRGYEVLYAVKLAIRECNESGGVGGYRVELVALDDGGDPALAALQVRELAVDPGVMGVVGHFTEETTLAAAPEYAVQGLVLIAPGAGGQEITAGGWVMRFGPSNQVLGREAARYAIEGLSAARLAVLRGQDDLADAFVSTAAQLGGKIVLDESIAGDDGGWAFRLAEGAPDLVFFAGGAVEGAEVIRMARQAGVEALFMGGPALGDRGLVQVGGVFVEGVVYQAAAAAGPDLAGAESFVAGYQALAGHAPGPRATLAYESAKLLLAAIDRAAGDYPGELARAAVWQQLAAGYRHEGLLGNLNWDGDGEPAGWPLALYCIEAGEYPGRRLR